MMSPHSDKLDAWSPKCGIECDERFHKTPKTNLPNLLLGGFKYGHHYPTNKGYFADIKEGEALGTRVLGDIRPGTSVCRQQDLRALCFSDLMKDELPSLNSRLGLQPTSSSDQHHESAAPRQPKPLRDGRKREQEWKESNTEEHKKEKQGTVKGKAKWISLDLRRLL